MLLFPFGFNSAPILYLQFLKMTLVFCIEDQCRRSPLQPQIRNQRFLRADVRRIPAYGTRGFTQAANLHETSSSARYGVKYRLNPCFEKPLHLHHPWDALEFACACKAAFLNGPLQSL